MEDPKLWSVRVKKGFERFAAMSVMNKMIYHASNGKPLAAISATYVKKLENFIYIEAHKKEHVREAIEGLQVCYQKVEILSKDDMVKLYDQD